MTDNSVLAEAMKDAGGGVTEVTDEKIANVSALANQQLVLEARVKDLEEMLTEAKDELRKVSEYDLPNALIEMGSRGFTLTDGSKIDIQKVYAANIKVQDRPLAFKWMRDEGHESLIKAEVKVPFAKGDVEAAEKVKEAIEAILRENGFDNTVELEESVHWQTLRAFVREQIEAEEEAIKRGETEAAKMHAIPRDLLGVHIIDKAKITVPKKKK